ncbi:hypothetical protein EDS67_28480 [candidate division KSB1 bacterium]|nr:MAG: hypothetical protein EDS67_28480 [candidate division KSB1 bacterium]
MIVDSARLSGIGFSIRIPNSTIPTNHFGLRIDDCGFSAAFWLRLFNPHSEFHNPHESFRIAD